MRSYLRHMILALLALGLGGCAAPGYRPGPMGQDALFTRPRGVETRWFCGENQAGEKGKGGAAHFGRKGQPCLNFIKPGETRTLAEVQGRSGTVRRMWFAFSDWNRPEVVRSLKLEMYWDGASKPAVSVPIGDFCGLGWGQWAPFQSALFSSPEGRSYNCFVPMPFRDKMKITITNESKGELFQFFYQIDTTLGERHGKDMLYFHSHWRRQSPTKMQRDFEILPRVAGAGRYLGATISVQADMKNYGIAWWGEGEVKIYLDGDTKLPTLCGTGTEDYIGDGWGQGYFSNLYQGCPVADDKKMRYCFYRLHVPDPVYFDKECRVTIMQLGILLGPGAINYIKQTGLDYYAQDAKGGLLRLPVEKWDPNKDGAIFERQDDWAACAYFYLDKPENSLPALAPVAERVAGLSEAGALTRQDAK